MEKIINRVENSGLIAIDLADYLPKMNSLFPFDFAPLLWNGLILKEKEFRTFVKEHDWSIYLNQHVYIFCSEDAILPSWAFMLVSSKLIGIAETITVGNESDAKQSAMEKTIRTMDLKPFQNGKIIIKGCSEIPNPEGMMSLFLSIVQPICASVMYGEPCSTVPIFKQAKAV